MSETMYHFPGKGVKVSACRSHYPDFMVWCIHATERINPFLKPFLEKSVKMTEKLNEIIDRVIADITKEEAIALQVWAMRLLDLRHSGKSGREKLQAVIRLTQNARILFPIIKKIATELKKTGWDERSWQSKAGMGAAFGATLLVGKAVASLALLGGAVAVPLWIVFGNGDQFVKMLIKDLKQKVERF